jgi:phosphoadenosine phosphosulfate reductase
VGLPLVRAVVHPALDRPDRHDAEHDREHDGEHDREHDGRELVSTTTRAWGPERVAEAAAELDGAPAQAIARWALETFDGEICAASSMQDAALVDLVARIRPDVPVVFLDTGYHFAETIGTRDAVAAAYPVRLLDVTPLQTVAEQDAQYGPRLHDRDPDLCCALRKVEPLERALAPFTAWLTGLRRVDSPTRAALGVVEWDARRSMVKVNPLAAWTDDDTAAYIEEHGVLVNPLLQLGYPSIGCAPCTRPVASGEDPRSGRWAGLGKTECGLHA